MATSKKDREALLRFDRGDNWVAPWEIMQREEEERRRREEEERLERQRERLRSGEAWAGVTGSADTRSVRSDEGIMGVLNGLADRMEFERQRVGTQLSSTFGLEDVAADRTLMYDDIPEHPGLTARGDVYPVDRERLELQRWMQANPEEAERQLRAREAPLMQALEQVEQSYKDNPNVVARTIGDIGGSYKSGFSILGGLAGSVLGPGGSIAGAALGSIPMADMAYNMAFSEAIREGLPEEEARQFATTMASSEFLFEMAGGKAISAIGVGGFVKDQLKKRVLRSKNRAIAGVALAATAGYGEEAITELGQAATTQKWAQLTDNPEFQTFLENQVPRLPDGTIDPASLLWQTHRAGLAGAGMGASVVTPIKAFEHSAEMGRLAAETERKVRDAEHRSGDFRRSTAIVPTEQPSLFGDLEATGESYEAQEAQRQRDLETDAGLQQGRQREGRERHQEAQRTSILARIDTARENVEVLQEQVEEGDRSDATLSALARATREQRAAENTLASFDETSYRAPPAPAATTAPTQEATQLDLGFQENPAQAAAIKEAQDLLKKDEASVAKKAKKARDTARQNALRPVIEENRSRPQEERVRALSEATLAWDEANPIESFQAQAAVPTPPKRGRGRRTTATQVQETTTTNVDQLRAMADEALKPSSEVQIPGQVAVDTVRAGLQRPSETVTSTTLRDVGNAVVTTLGKGDSELAARLLAQGNVELVASDTDIPAGAVALGSAGFYDGNKVYAVANRMNPDNIVGDLLDIAAHEVKHGGDLAASDTLRTTLPEFIGPEANARIIRQIEALAERDSEVKKVVDLARSTGNYEAEVVNYFTDAMRDARGRKPAIARIGQGILAATRTAAKRALPGDYEINLNDVAYLSDKLLRETAIQNPDLSMEAGTPAPNLQMIVRGEAGGKDSYIGKDGKIKRWFTDADSRIVIPEDVLELLRNGEMVALEDVLKHDTLFQEYPQLRGFSFKAADLTSLGYSGMYDSALETVTLDQSFLDDYFGEEFDTPLHQVLLHEVQHAVQDIEGFSGGTNPNIIASKHPGLRAAQTKAGSLRDGISGIGIMLNKADPDLRALSIIYAVPFAKVEAVFDRMDRAGLFKTSTPVGSRESAAAARNSHVFTIGRRFIESLRAEVNTPSKRLEADMENISEYEEARARVEDILAQADVQYLNNAGESEARFTESNISVRDLSREDIQMPRATGRGIETRIARGRAQDGVNPENIYGPDTWVEEGISAESAAVEALPMEERLAANDARRVPFVGLASKPFPRSVKIGDNKRMLDKIPRFIKRLLLPAGGHHEAVAQIVSYGQSLPASLAAQSTAFGNRFEDAMKNAARKNNKTVDEIKAEVGKRVEKIDELETRAERVSATLALNRDFPGVGTTLNDLRDFKLAQAREIVNLRLRDPKPLEGKELAVYNKIIANAERYTTRAYLATYQKDIGERYGKNLLAKFNKDPNSREGKIVADAMEYLIHNELLVPDQAGLEAMSRGDLRRMYEAWYGNSARHTGKQGHANMLEKLSNMPPKTKEQVEAKALEVIEDMLGLTENQRARNVFLSPSVRQNRTVLEARSDMPEVLRTLMGEITDPVTREMISLQRMTNLRAKTVVLTELFEKTEGLAWSDHRTEKFNQQLNNVAYGPLDGAWISQDTADAITGTILNMHNVDEALAAMAKEPDLIMKALLGQHLKASHQIMSLQKTMQVVLSPFNMVMNFTGALAIMAPMQGIVNPKTYARGIRDTVNVLALEISSRANTPAQLAISAELLEAQVVDSATVGEFKGNAWKTIIRDLEKMIDGGKLTPFKVIKTVARELFAAGEAANAARQLYAFMDVWVKVATYYDRKNFWEAYNKAEGGTMTPEQILRTAGREASGTNISYERAIPLARALERNVPLFMFLTYFSETFRAAGMSYVQAYRDLKLSTQATTPKGKALAASMGMKRLAGTLAMTAGIQAAVLAALDSEDEEEKKKRWLDADWMVDKIFVPLGIDEAGNELMIELQRIDPIGPMNEFFIGIANAEEGKHTEAAMQGIVDMFVESKGAIAVGKLIWDLGVHSAATATGREGIREWEAARQKNTITERNYPKIYNYLRNHPVYGAGDLGENFIAAVERLMIPTAIMPTLDAERTAIAETRPGDLSVPISGKPLGPVARKLGYRAYTRDPDKALFFRVMDYNDQIKALRTKRDELNNAAPSMSESQLIGSLLDIREAEQEAFTKVQRGYEGYLAFEGKKPADAIAIIDNKKLARSVRAGQFESQLLDGEAIDRWYKTQQGRRGVDKAELREKYRIMKRLYAEAK